MPDHVLVRISERVFPGGPENSGFGRRWVRRTETCLA